MSPRGSGGSRAAGAKQAKGRSPICAGSCGRAELCADRSRPRAVLALAVMGALLWAAAGENMPWLRCLIVAAAAGLSLVRPVNRLIAFGLDQVRNPSRRALEWAGIFVGVAATAYLIYTAFAQNRDLFPKTEDDSSYLIGAQMIARGRLWMPQHPLADFFE